MASTMNELDSMKHLLALKVMRMTKPTLLNGKVVTSESKDLPRKSLIDTLQTKNGCETITPSQLMLLPQSFGNIYLGETFSSFICVHNCTSHTVDSVSVKADLQTNNTRINLPIHVDRKTPISLQPDETLDDMIHHEVKEMGTHILVCEVHYVTSAGLPTSFRKFFKFQVIKPLDVKTKFYNAETDKIYIEAQIQNKSFNMIYLEDIRFECSEDYTVSSMDLMSDKSSIKPNAMLHPDSNYQFLYCIQLDKPSGKGDNLSAPIGKLDIVWRSHLGELGRLQTSPFLRSILSVGDLQLVVIKADSVVILGNPFNFTCRITNFCERSMDLLLNLSSKKKADCQYSGQIEYTIGLLETNTHVDVDLTVFPLRPGFLTISDLKISDLVSKRIFDFDEFIQVFVKSV